MPSARQQALPQQQLILGILSNVRELSAQNNELSQWDSSTQACYEYHNIDPKVNSVCCIMEMAGVQLIWGLTWPVYSWYEA